MNLFSTHTGELNPADIAVAQALADVATIGILQERTIKSSSIITAQLQHALDSRILIEQAKGVLAATSGMTMNDAFVAIRAYARNHNLTLAKVADAVIARTLDVTTATTVK
jgi:AmiR/NasT family two-component response regulator